jgi:catecholate siderophore receptor
MVRSRRRPAPRPSKRGIVRLFSLNAFVISAALTGGSAAAQVPRPPAPAQAPAVVRFDIAPGPLDEALRAFEATTGLVVRVQLPADTVHMMASPGVSGAFAIADALTALLDGTALAGRIVPGGDVVVDVAAVRESLTVTGRLPRVASPNYATSLADTPQTIQVIPQGVMAEQGSFTLSDAMRNVPGITIQAGEGGGASSTAGDMFSMRGFSAANSLFVDGVRDDGLLTRDVFNLEQVEVYLGPTGSDVGRGNAAGYVNMVTKTPRAGRAITAAASYGSADSKRVTADVNTPLPLGDEGTWLHGTAVRLNALWQDAGVAGRDFTQTERVSLAPAVALGLGTPTRVTLFGQFTSQDGLPDYGIPGAAWETPLAPTSVLTSRPVDQSTFYGSLGHDHDRGDQETLTARVEHDLAPGWMVRNQTRRNETTRDAVVTAVQSVASYLPATETVVFSRQANYRRNAILDNQTTLTGRVTTGALSHALTATVEFIREEYSAPGRTGAGTRANASVYAPDPFAPVTGFAPADSGATTDARTTTMAASIFDVITRGRLQVTGGVRAERYDTAYRALALTGVRTDLDVADTMLSGKAGVLVRLGGGGNAYVSYGSTVTPPGSGNFALSAQPNNANSPNVDPQVSRNLEVGSKWELFNGRLSATLALFDTRNENVIYTIDATAVPPLFNQDDEQRLQGGTIGLFGQLTRGWSLMANAAYLDGRQHSQGATLDGRQLTLMPKWSGTVWTTYALRQFTLGGGIRYSDRTFVNTANSIAVPAYYLVDGVASWAVTPHLTLRLNAYNLTDERYIRSISNNGGRYNPGLRRAVLLTTHVGF